MTIENLTEVVTTLIGPTVPVGDHDTDLERLENIKAMSQLTTALLNQIGAISELRDRPEASVSKIANFADQYLNVIVYEY